MSAAVFMVMEHSLHKAVLILTLVALCSSALSKHYYIVPANSTDLACTGFQDCLTLEKLAQSDLISAGEANLTLSFLPGHHVLIRSLIIHKFSVVHLNGLNKSAVSFHKNKIKVTNCTELWIENLYLVQNRHSTAIKIRYAKNINLDKIRAKGNREEAIKIEASCNVTLLDCEFTRNFGDILYIDSISTVISHTKFDSNTGRVLTIYSVITIISQCNITNNVNPQGKGITHINQHSKFTAPDCGSLCLYDVLTLDTAIQACRVDKNHINTVKLDSDWHTLSFTNKVVFCDGILRAITIDLTSGRVSIVNRTSAGCLNSWNDSANFFKNVISDEICQAPHRIDKTKTTSNQQAEITLNTNQYEGVVNKCCKTGNIIISSCYYTNNTSQLGGAIAIYSPQESVNVLVASCSFTNNTSHWGGGAIWISAYSQKSNNVIVAMSSFTNNTSYKGGGGAIGIDSRSQNYSNGNVVITLCSFSNNTASQWRGGAVYIYSQDFSSRYVLINFCSFTNNTSLEEGGAVEINLSSQEYNNGSVIISSCSFTNNTSQEEGGGAIWITIDSQESNNGIVFITSCSFFNNTSQNGGGAIDIDSTSQESNNGDIIISTCSFTSNTNQLGRGGAVEISSTSQESTSGHIIIVTSSFNNNTSLMEGGAVWIYSAPPELEVNITFCSFSNNTSQEGGGAVAMYSQSMSTNEESHTGKALITACSFVNNTSQNGGGAILIYTQSQESGIIVTFCSFTNNTSQMEGGGAIEVNSASQKSNSGNLIIINSTFTNNTSQEGGGAIKIDSKAQESNILITACSFTNNTSHKGGGGIFIVVSAPQKSKNGNIIFTSCSFANNTCQLGEGGAIWIYFASQESNINITSCSFTNNTSLEGGGGAIAIDSQSTKQFDSANKSLIINTSNFTNNTSHEGGAVKIFTESQESTVIITSCCFTSNVGQRRGGAIMMQFFSQKSFTKCTLITSCSFYNNTSLTEDGAALYLNILSHNGSAYLLLERLQIMTTSGNGIYIVGVDNVIIANSKFEHNTKTVFNLQHSSAIFLRGNYFSNNHGSIYAFNSRVEFMGLTIFTKNYYLAAIFAIQSQVYFNSPDRTVITNNTALAGGGVFLSESTMTVYHPIEISHNTADYGGGIYAYLSSIVFTSERENYISTSCIDSEEKAALDKRIKQVRIAKNSASQNGGGIFAIASTIKVSNSFVDIDANTASSKGGGVYLEQNSRITLLKQFPESCWLFMTVRISGNLAQYGGGIFTADKTAGGSLCNGSLSGFAISTECFIQTIRVYSEIPRSNTNYWNTIIANNKASISGDAIYGGLLDRCTISSQTEVITTEKVKNTLDYISRTVLFSDPLLTGAPPKVHYPLCNTQAAPQADNKNCFNNSLLYSSVSSEPVQVILCDTTNIIHMRKGRSIHVAVRAIDQVGNPVNGTIHCSVITESGVGRLKEGQAEQRVGSQCTELEYNVFSQDSSAQLELYADGPCTNLGVSKRVINISFLPCTCATGLQPSNFILDCECVCDSKLQPYVASCFQESGTVQREPNLWIGIQENSTHNETGYIIHECPFDYCLDKPVNISLNNSQERDRQCAYNRSGILCGKCQQGLSLMLATSKCDECSNISLFLLVPFALAGIMLIIFILLFNITIATGTIHGLIIYANLLATNKATFLPFTVPNVLTVFISWVNLDLGIETCFYSQMSSQAKVLLQLVFPAYLFLLIFLIIILSRYFIFFSKLLSNRNPVAAVSTLILLSYSKLLRFITAALQSTVLELPDGSQRRVWLYDANAQYFTPIHTPRFVAAAIILTAGGWFAVLLFFSQWLPQFSNWKLMKWTRNTKYTGFMDTFHAPFTPKHRYWVGLLLFALIIHNIVAAMATDTFLPVLSAVSLSFGLTAIRVFGSRIYKDWSKDTIETLFFLNLGIFAAGTFYTKGSKYEQQILAQVSIAITFILFIMITFYHCNKYIITKEAIWVKLALLKNSLINRVASLRLTRANSVQQLHQLVADDESNELLEVLDYNNEQLDIVDPLYTGGGEEEANTNQYCTPPNIVLATRPDQLREPALDDLAPITPGDYQLAPPFPESQVNSHQEVTYSVVDPVVVERKEC